MIFAAGHATAAATFLLLAKNSIDMAPTKVRYAAMKMIRTTLLAAALSFTVSAALAANAHIGSWKLNESKSKMDSGGSKNTMVTYRQGSNGMIKLTCDAVDKDGKMSRWSWEGKFDGKQYKAKGAPMADSIAYNVVDSHTNKLTAMKNGKVAMTGTIQVAGDGKSRTVTTTVNGKTSVSYYDRISAR